MSTNPYQPLSKKPGMSAGASRSKGPKHGIFGIIAFIISILAGGLSFLSLVIATVAASGGDVAEDEPMVIAAGLGIILALALHLVGGILGVVGLFMPDTKKLFAILGLVFNAVVFLGMVALMVVGLTLG